MRGPALDTHRRQHGADMTAMWLMAGMAFGGAVGKYAYRLFFIFDIVAAAMIWSIAGERKIRTPVRQRK